MNIPRLILRALLGSRRPVTRGRLTVPALRDRVTIRRDRWGIPCIDSSNDHDAWFGLGFCHGQDRAFQIHVLARVVRGPLAEVVGREALAVDRLSRRIGFRRSADRQLPRLEADIRSMLDAYVAGVNAAGVRPHELTLLRAKPIEWHAADVLALLKLQAFGLAANWDVELARLRILTVDGPAALAALDPAYPEWLPTTSPVAAPAGPAIDRLSDDLDAFAAAASIGGASNNWAIAPSRTTTGRPILANDPHMAPMLPPHWYLAHVRTPEWAVAGASLVGGPAIAAGHNGFCGWGVTAGFVDGADLFIEEAPVPGDVRLERIDVRGEEPVVEEVVETPRGPVISPALDGPGAAISMSAVWLDAVPVRGLLDAHRARSFEEFRAAFAYWPGPSLNVAYADRDGHVGWQLVGASPVRKRGWGTFPQTADGTWTDERVAFNDMPHASDPPEGFVATANNAPLPAGTGPFLGADWLDGYRAQRITESIASRSDWDVPRAQSLQLDLTSVPWREMRDAVLASPADAGVLAMMSSWDGRVTADSHAATIYERFVADMARRVARAKAPRSFEWALGRGFTPLVPHTFFAVRRSGHLVRLLREQPGGWFERGWPREIADALTAAAKDARPWGEARPLTLMHPFGRRGGALAKLFNLGPMPCGGDADTVAQHATDLLEPSANPRFIPSLRMVLDVGAWGGSRFALPGGQSGNPLSPHYADQLPLWARGEGVPIAWDAEEVRRATVTTLTLEKQTAEDAEKSGFL